jgi:hypothetical protein
MSLTREGAMSMVEFIKEIAKDRPGLEYRIKDDAGRVYKSRGWDDKVQSNKK